MSESEPSESGEPSESSEPSDASSSEAARYMYPTTAIFFFFSSHISAF